MRFNEVFGQERRIGDAIYGRIVAATHKKHGSVKAVKIVRKDLAASQRSTTGHYVMEDVRREMHLMKLLRTNPHPNLLPSEELSDVLQDERNHYVVMPYFKRGDLFEMVLKDGAVGERRARHFLTQLISALQHLHSLGWCHRDVSMENILLGSRNSSTPSNERDHQDEIILCDYGLATTLGSTGTSVRPGKFRYMAPEVYRKRAVGKAKASTPPSCGTSSSSSLTPPSPTSVVDSVGTGPKNEVAVCIASDAFSAGVVLFVLITGYPPFERPDVEADKRYAAIARGQEGVKWLLQSWGLSVSEECSAILAGLLNPCPHARMQLGDALGHPWMMMAKVKEGGRTQRKPVGAPQEND